MIVKIANNYGVGASACKGGLTRDYSVRLGSVQRTPHELSSVSHHRLRFIRSVWVCGWGRGKPCSWWSSWLVHASHRRTVLSSDSLARKAQLALKATHVTLFSWPAGAVRAIIMGILLSKVRRGCQFRFLGLLARLLSDKLWFNDGRYD